ncbi:MAG: L-threonylcarbamoyladenylate synthase [Treponema sp.]|jgi:tRNA threonylcarbamoyl adenosine modification protein (Sua5/YciO/YrdC/YwlC family)|nr:L-threonylcarbamoyladenylate synthase [Treponema sp.]
MIEYIVPSNIDDRILARAVRMLEKGGLIALPTDTSWSIVCSIKSSDAIKKLRHLSGERDERHFTLLCSSISQFAEVCSLDNTRFRLIKRLSPGPYVFILKTLSGTEKALDIRRREVGVRIPDHPVPIGLINSLGNPLYSITAKRNMTGIDNDEIFHNEAEETSSELPPIPEEELFESGWELEEISGVDLILDSAEERERIFSTILDLYSDEIKMLRQGAGAWPA